MKKKKFAIIEKKKKAIDTVVALREKENSLMSKDAIIALCEKKFSYLLDSGYTIDFWGKTASFNYRKGIEKYCRHASFLYEEYDGCMQFVRDREKNEDYQRILNRYSKKISRCKLDFSERLSLGDKDWLSYNSCYKLTFPDLKKETIKKMLAKF